MKRDITDKGFRAFLETLTWHELYWTSRYDIHPEVMIEVLLEQDWDYYDYLINLTDKDEEPDDYIVLYPEIRSALEELDEESLLHFYMNWVSDERVIDELMFLDEDARINLLENFDPPKYIHLTGYNEN
jgi:hypothetical protein